MSGGARAHPPAPGDFLGPYQVLGPIREGGMGSLLLARRRGAGGFTRLVALKAVHANLRHDPRAIRRFLDEARLSACVQHPNVVHVEDLLEVGSTYYLVMEYVRGPTLAAVMQRMVERGDRFEPPVAVHIAAEIAEALHAAHEAHDEHGRPLRVVHRDVSPHNVLVTHTGHVKLIDFGIAKAAWRLLDSTSGGVLGRLRYLAPEQVLGHAIDRRTDLYALGIVTWEMLTMVELFGVDVALVEHRRHEVRPPSHYRSGIPEALDRAVLAALEVDPDGRPPTTLAYRQLLRGALPESSFVDAQRLARLVRRLLEAPGRSTPERTVVDLVSRPFESLTDDITTRPMRRRPRLRSRLLRLIAAMAGIAALGVAVFFLFAKLI